MPISFEDTVNRSLGKLSTDKKEVTLKDYINLSKGGRFWKQIALFFDGKGWLNEKNMQKLIRNLDFETLKEIDLVCNEVIKNLNQTLPSSPIEDSGDLLFTTKKAKNHPVKIDKIAEEAGILKLSVEKEMGTRKEKILEYLKPVKTADLEKHPFLKSEYQNYIIWLNKQPAMAKYDPSDVIAHAQYFLIRDGAESKNAIQQNALKLGFDIWLAEGVTQNRLPQIFIHSLTNAIVNEGKVKDVFELSQLFNDKEASHIFRVFLNGGNWINEETFGKILSHMDKNDLSTLLRYCEENPPSTNSDRGKENMQDLLNEIYADNRAQFELSTVIQEKRNRSPELEQNIKNLSSLKDWIKKENKLRKERFENYLDKINIEKPPQELKPLFEEYLESKGLKNDTSFKGSEVNGFVQWLKSKELFLGDKQKLHAALVKNHPEQKDDIALVLGFNR